MRIATGIASLLVFTSAQAQIVTSGHPVVDCRNQSPKLMMNSAHFKLGRVGKVTVQAPSRGTQTLYLVGTVTPAKVIPSGQSLGLGGLVSYMDLGPETPIFAVTTDAGGTGQLDIPVGENPSLMGSELFFQVFSLSNPNCSGPSAFSNSALRKVVIGPGPAPTDPTFATSVSSGSITWTFDRSVEVGTFYNGHRWAKGPFKVVGITPAPANGRNGSMVDPSSLGLQAYDSRRNYDASLAANATTLDFTTATNIKSVVSTVSTPATETNRFLQEVQVLTVIPASQASPSPMAMRPSYHQGQKVIVSVDDLVEEPDTLFSFLPANAQYGAPMPTLSELQALVDQSTFPVVLGNWGTNAFNGSYPGYGRELALLVSHGMLYALHQGMPQRKKILAAILQMGIDIAGVTANGGALSAFRGDGGQMNGRKFPLVALAKALVNGSLKNSLYANILASRFSEDDQIRPAPAPTSPWFNPNTGTAFYFSLNQPVDLTHPSNWLASEFNKASYKFCCTFNVAGGTSLATSVINGWDAWQNDQFKIGVDGYYRVENLLDQYNAIATYTVLAGNAPLGPASWFIDNQGHGLHWSNFVAGVWAALAPGFAP